MSFHDTGGTVVRFRDGDVVFVEGDPARHLFVVTEGRVVIRKEGGIVATVVAELGPGEMFGETALIGQRSHAATAVALGDAVLAAYDRDAFLAALRTDPELALRVIESLSGRLRETTQKLQSLCTQYVLDKTEMALVERAVLHGGIT
jgi:CRP/FNR family transcriptional regulator, cyclic AMP receptor protein